MKFFAAYHCIKKCQKKSRCYDDYVPSNRMISYSKSDGIQSNIDTKSRKLNMIHPYTTISPRSTNLDCEYLLSFRVASTSSMKCYLFGQNDGKGRIFWTKLCFQPFHYRIHICCRNSVNIFKQFTSGKSQRYQRIGNTSHIV
jgi:hypothetical protein